MPTYIQKVDASDLSLGGAATRVISAGTGTDTSFTETAANGGGTETHYFVTPSGVPNSDSWESGGSWTVEVEVDVGDASVTCEVRVGRCDSGGTILQTGSFTATQAMDVTRSFSPTAPTWTGGEEACDNRLFVELLFTNNAAHGSHDVTVGVGTTANEVVTDVTEDAGSCGVADAVKDPIMGGGIIPFARSMWMMFRSGLVVPSGYLDLGFRLDNNARRACLCKDLLPVVVKDGVNLDRDSLYTEHPVAG